MFPAGTELLFAETEATHPFVIEEQMMPFIPVTRVKTVEEGIEASVVAEHGYRHTSIIHTHDVTRMTAMAKALETTLFVKNGASVAALGNGGERLSQFHPLPRLQAKASPRPRRSRACAVASWWITCGSFNLKTDPWNLENQILL